MSVLRPLPSRPSLAFDRKAAKALLRSIRAGDSDAVARAEAQHSTFNAANADRATLADAQLVIAREYGFTSWPRLVQYHAGIERQGDSFPTLHGIDFYEQQSRALVAAHGKGRFWAGRLLAAYVPRFYGMPVEDVYAHPITESDARLAMARSQGCPSWAVLIERTRREELDRASERDWGMDPWRRAHDAIGEANLDALQTIVDEHPSLLRPNGTDGAMGRNLLTIVFDWERQLGREALRPIVAWLVEQGQDVQRSLNMRLYDRRPKRPDDVRALLERGADPNWVAASGIPVLEHALLRWWNGDAVDLIAAHAKHRDALWIAAGLGDVAGVSRFLDKRGQPTRAARMLRPPLDAMGSFSLPVLPDPSDEEILHEAFWVAVINSRIAVIEYLISRGLNVNSRVWGTPVVNVAVGNGWTAVVECLVRAGADLDIHEGNSNGTARDMARTMFSNGSHGPGYRRIVELCGLDPDAILAERDAAPLPTPIIMPALQRALDMAVEHAAQHGNSAVTPEHLFLGLLLAGALPLQLFLQAKGLDRERFRADFIERTRHGETGSEGVTLPMDPDAQALVDAAVALAASRRRDAANGHHLLYVLARLEHGMAATLLAQHGSSAAELLDSLENLL